MDSETSTRHHFDQLERVLLDGNAEPIYVPLSLLEEITNYFSVEHQIGSGGFAVVYKGIVREGMIAVKKLSRTFDLPESKFHKEVECLVKAKHKNIVRFLGYCSEIQGRIAEYEGKFVMSDIRNWLLCFEYVPNGSLDKYITDASGGLEWRDRYEIIKGICEGLVHLHKMHILHLDLKPSNILIDNGMIPKIADFGLSRCLDEEQTHVFTSNLCGSQGYLAPEFYRGQVAYASDIYSLGCIIMEILTGEKGYPEDQNVVDNWMNRLEGSDHWDMQLEQVRVCMKIGIECMDLNPKNRPVARQIIDRLDRTSSRIETSISSSLVKQQGSFLEEQHYQEEATKLASEYAQQYKEEHAETQEPDEYVAKPREDHWQQGQDEAVLVGDQSSLWGAQDAKQNVSPQGASISGSRPSVPYKLKNPYNGGPTLASVHDFKRFKRAEHIHSLKSSNIILKGGLQEVCEGILDNVPVTLRKLGQYSLLQDFDSTHRISNYIHYGTLGLVDKAKKGRRRGKHLTLSRQMMEPIIDSLVKSQGHLTDGARALRLNGFYDLFSWACEAGDEKVTHTILVWHVATSICRNEFIAALAKDERTVVCSPTDCSAIDTATGLSNYCAYLVAFLPDLLPGHSVETASKLDKSIEEARNMPSLQGTKTLGRKCEILLSIIGTADTHDLVIVGARLARLLMDIKDKMKQWKLLMDFWAEMILYIAPCDDSPIGAEFITHLWALLTHAGVLERGPARPPDVV